MGEMADSTPNLGFDGSAKNAIGPAKLAVILKRYPRFEIRAENGRIAARLQESPSFDRSQELSSRDNSCEQPGSRHETRFPEDAISTLFKS